MSVENNKDENTLLKQLDIVVATNMVANAWKETNSTIIQNCFCKAGFKHHAVDPDPVPEEALVTPAQTYGTKFRDGWVMCSLMILWPVNLRHLQHSL